MRVVSSSRFRGILAMSVAIGAIACADTARAQTAADPSAPDGMQNTPSIVISAPGTPTTAQDPTNITGIGQMVIDEKNGFLGLCTGTLINPRTVLFNAHCVNENPAGTGVQDPWGYGAKFGGIPISFGFQQNNLPGVRSWFLSGPAQYQTNQSLAIYNVNQVLYNPQSVALGIQNNFYQADIALASLDTPAKGIPTWALLLSQLPAPSGSTLNGTGYHVVESGYGTNGVGALGANGGIDYRRRVAENFLGILGSIADIDAFLFGVNVPYKQNVYQLDFDDPLRGKRGGSPYDFNIFPDPATPKEGITAPGDSGGPLILDKTYSKPVVIGSLSGGSRFFLNQPSASYGTTSFYQPLYLFWDYIVANNPYRYAGSVAGDAKWTDPTHWQTLLDPAFQILVNGQLANGLPAAPGDGINGTSGKFGQVCYQTDCVDLTTGIETIDGKPVTATAAAPAGASIDSNGRAVAKADGLLTAADNQAQDGATSTATMGTEANTPLPAPTLANGLPGATNFVPNNVDPDPVARRNARYFDVTLASAGTTTLDTIVAIDNLTIASNLARLVVANTGSLTSNLGITHTIGTVQNDGVITSGGDYLLVAGNLTGSGRINAGYFTSILGTIAPGTLGTTGTLTFGGNVILASGNTLLVDLGPNLTSDRVAVLATQFSDAAKTKPIDGQANVGGRVLFGPVAGTTVRYGDLYTIVTAQGGVSGAFTAPSAISAILTPRFVYTTNAVQVAVDAGLYANVVGNTPVQQAYAQLLDRSRGQYTGLSGLYGPLDLASVVTIQGTLEGLAPRAETLKGAIGVTELDNMARFYRDRLTALGRGDMGGTIAVIGNPAQTLAAVATPQQAAIGGTVSTNDEAVVSPTKLPSNVSAFVAGGYIDGHSRPMATAVPLGGKDRFDGYFLAGGIEAQVAAKGFIGFSISYSDLDGTTDVAGQTVKGKLALGTLYGKYTSPNGLTVDGQASAGQYDVRTRRGAVLPGSVTTLTGRDRPLALSGELGVSEEFGSDAVAFGPRVAVRGSRIEFTPEVETGGPAALRIDRQAYSSFQGRAGLFLAGQGRFSPYATGYYVHEFDHPVTSFGATFAGAPGVAPVAFALAGTTKDWGELSAGIKINGPRLSLSVGADTTVGRKDVENQSYRGTVTLKF